MFKKKLSVFMVLAMLSTSLFLTACGGSSSDTGNNEAAQTEELAETDGTIETLEDYFKAYPEDLESIKSSIEEQNEYKDILDMDVSVEGNKLSYIYTYKDTYTDDQLKDIKAELEKSLAEPGESLEESAQAMEKGFGVDGIEIYMEYRNGDGSTICSGQVR